MSFKDALARAKEHRPEPTLVPVAVGDELFQVEVSRLDGMDWAAITAECPPSDEKSARLGYDTNKAALIACRRHSRLLDDAGEPVNMAPETNGTIKTDPWRDLFSTISGVEIGALAATWWSLNMHDPNQQVQALKKASAAATSTS